MKKVSFSFFAVLLISFACTSNSADSNETISPSKPTISFTFDDGVTNDILHYPFKEWNEMILQSLDDADLKAIFFVTGFNKLDKKGQYLLKSWDDRGHKIANHTFSHPNFNDPNVSLDDFQDELLQADSVIRSYKNFIPLFRFPYLKEGNTDEKIEGFRQFLKEKEYKNGYVTIDASDWYVDSRLKKQMRDSTDVNVDKFKAFYLDHIIERATFYEDLSQKLNGRPIQHTLLLHHNLTSALFLSDLIERFKKEGWEVIDADQAYQDEVFTKIPNVNPAGESLIWSLAKETGQYEEILRYPAEDSRYEKDKMDKLGL